MYQNNNNSTIQGIGKYFDYIRGRCVEYVSEEKQDGDSGSSSSVQGWICGGPSYRCISQGVAGPDGSRMTYPCGAEKVVEYTTDQDGNRVIRTKVYPGIRDCPYQSCSFSSSDSQGYSTTLGSDYEPSCESFQGYSVSQGSSYGPSFEDFQECSATTGSSHSPSDGSSQEGSTATGYTTEEEKAIRDFGYTRGSSYGSAGVRLGSDNESRSHATYHGDSVVVSGDCLAGARITRSSYGACQGDSVVVSGDYLAGVDNGNWTYGVSKSDSVAVSRDCLTGADNGNWTHGVSQGGSGDVSGGCSVGIDGNEK